MSQPQMLGANEYESSVSSVCPSVITFLNSYIMTFVHYIVGTLYALVFVSYCTRFYSVNFQWAFQWRFRSILPKMVTFQTSRLYELELFYRKLIFSNLACKAYSQSFRIGCRGYMVTGYLVSPWWVYVSFDGFKWIWTISLVAFG